MTVSTLREYCVVVAQQVLSYLLGDSALPEGAEFEALVEDLEKEFIQAYAQKGSPYGASEDDLVRFLLKHTIYEIEQ